MMRILFLAHRVPFPLDKGDRIRSYNIIKLLAKSHTVFLMAVRHEPIHAATHDVLHRYCATIEIFKINPQLSKLRSALYMCTTRPLTLPLFYNSLLERAIKQRLKSTGIDLIYIYSSPMAQYLLTENDTPKVMDFIDLDSQKWFDYAEVSRQPLKSLYYREGVTLRKFEKKVASLCGQNIFAAEREAMIFKQIAPRTPVKVVQNGVDVNSSTSRSVRGNKLVFVGAMDYFPNVDAMLYFTSEILPLVQRFVPDVHLLIIGRNPPSEVRRLNRLNGVSVTGYVADVGPYLRSAVASVAPLRIGRGVQQKILEAMAHGLPVIATSAAFGSIDAVPGQDLLVADDPGSFAEKLVVVLKDRSLCLNLGRNALAVVKKKYTWESRLQDLEECIRPICRKNVND